MANPQLENGHLKIANELIEAILAADLGRREQKVIWAVIRKTYGFNKKADAISNWQIAQLTGIDRAHVKRTIRDLVARNIVTAEPSGLYRHGIEVQRLAINKDHECWLTGAKTATVAETYRGQNSPGNRGQNGSETGAKTAPTKDSKDRKTERTRARANGSPKRPDDISEQTWSDFLSIRRTKKAPLTETAWNRISQQLDLAAEDGWSRDEALAEAVTAGWQGFRYEWLKNRCRDQGREPAGKADRVKPADDPMRPDAMGRIGFNPDGSKNHDYRGGRFWTQ